MDCREVRGALSALIDNELPPGKAAAVRAHLDQCPSCLRIANAYTRDDRVLRQFVRSAPYLPVANDVRRRIRADQERPGIWPALAKGGYRVATAMAMVALVALITVSGFALRDMANRDNDQPLVATSPTETAEVALIAPSPTVEPEPSEPQVTEAPSPAVTPQPSPTAVPPTPSAPTPTPVVITPTPTPAPAQLLPEDLYFLAELNGRTALWVQPSDGSEPRVIASDTTRSVTSFELMAGTDLIAYTLSPADGESNAPVQVVDKSGQGSGMPMSPDGQPVAEYVMSPDSMKTAFVSIDRSSLWVGEGDGANVRSLYEVEIPEVEGIHNVRWSPNGERLLFELTRIATPTRPTVVEVTSGETVWQGTRDVLDMVWDHDSEGLLISGYSQIYRVDLTDGKETNVTPDALRTPSGVTQPQVVSNLTWLPDGRIAFTLHDDGSVYSNADLWLMHADGSDAWRATRDLGPVSDVTWVFSGEQYGFVVGTIASDQISSQPTLRYYATHHAEPVDLSAGIESRVFGPSEWRAAP